MDARKICNLCMILNTFISLFLLPLHYCRQATMQPCFILHLRTANWPFHEFRYPAGDEWMPRFFLFTCVAIVLFCWDAAHIKHHFLSFLGEYLLLKISNVPMIMILNSKERKQALLFFSLEITNRASLPSTIFFLPETSTYCHCLHISHVPEMAESAENL